MFPGTLREKVLGNGGDRQQSSSNNPLVLPKRGRNGLIQDGKVMADLFLETTVIFAGWCSRKCDHHQKDLRLSVSHFVLFVCRRYQRLYSMVLGSRAIPSVSM